MAQFYVTDLLWNMNIAAVINNDCNWNIIHRTLRSGLMNIISFIFWWRWCIWLRPLRRERLSRTFASIFWDAFRVIQKSALNHRVERKSQTRVAKGRCGENEMCLSIYTVYFSSVHFVLMDWGKNRVKVCVHVIYGMSHNENS